MDDRRTSRAKNNRNNGRVGYCFGVPATRIAKAAAERDKDRHFCMDPIECAYLTPAQALEMEEAAPPQKSNFGVEEYGALDIEHNFLDWKD